MKDSYGPFHSVSQTSKQLHCQLEFPEDDTTQLLYLGRE